jgi:hypothetical protein
MFTNQPYIANSILNYEVEIDSLCPRQRWMNGWVCTLQCLEVWVENYGQKKGHESNSQFDSWQLKPKNMDQMTLDWGVQHAIGKLFFKIQTL